MVDLGILAAGGGEGGNLGHGFGAGPAVVFLGAADDHGGQAEAGSNIEGADALDRVNLMTADGDQVSAQRFGPEGDFFEGLNGVRMEERGGTGGLQGVGDGTDIRDGAGFIIDQHEGDQNGIRTQRFPHLGGKNPPGGIRPQAGHFETPVFQNLQRAADGIMLDGGTDDMTAGAFHEFGAGQKGPVIAFGSAGGKDHLIRGGGAQGFRHVGTAGVQELSGLTALGMGGGRVAVAVCHGGEGGFRSLGAGLGSGGVIEIVFQ